MSRIGKKTIEIPDKVEIKLSGDVVVVKGPRGELTQVIHPVVSVKIEDKQVNISVDNPEDHNQKALWGLFRSLINNMVVGVTQGFERKLEINGVGYKAALSGSRKLILNLGFSHPVEFELPEGISATVEKNIVTILGTDKQVVGEVAASIRKIRKPEPYKGKGIKYLEEVLRRKAGKTATKGSA